MQPHTSAIVQPKDSKHCEEPLETKVLNELKRHVGKRNFKNWFHEKTTLTVSSDELAIGVPSPFLLSWMEKQFRSAILQVAQTVLGASARVRFKVDQLVSLERQEASKSTSTDEKSSLASHTPSRRRAARSTGRRFADLADFVQGTCNELALTAAHQVCETPGDRFNPLYLHGGVGIGKTHLLEGIYRNIRRQFPSLEVMFLTSEAFTNYFTEALRDHTLPSFRQRFRNVDVLLVDDIDFLDAKRVIQEEFLHTFKQLESHSRQIVLTADRHPRLLSKLSDELVTRFLSGLVCRIEPPDFETRKRIVRNKGARLQAKFSAEALTFVAKRFKNNVRELEGALNCLQTYYAMTGKQIGVTAARQVLADLERDCIRVVRLSDIEQVVCHLFRLKSTDLKSPRRVRSISQPRMLAMFLARKHTQAAYSEIGQYFGGRNHSTVMSAEKKVQCWLTDQTTIKIASEAWSMHEVLDALEHHLLAS